jgi:nitrite reductase/ring-hydroxylating ferredoxin subunit
MAGAAGAALVTLGACGGDGFQRVGAGGIDDTVGDPGAGGDPNAGGDGDLGTSGGGRADLAHGGGGGGGNPDMARGGGGGGGGNPDMAQPNMPPNPNACAGGATDTGKTAASVAVGTAVYVRSLAAFICRDNGGWFAVSAQCTHEGAIMSFTGTGFHCPRHGANFSLGGAVQSGPNGGPLDHYALCVTGNGTVGMDVNALVSSARRYSL